MSKKQKHKQAKKKQIVVSMALPQSKDKDMETLYVLFQKRVAEKSAENRADEAIDPVQMILAFPLLKIDTQMGVVVAKDSFEIITRKGSEVGFRARITSVFGKYYLYVYRKGKAYLEK